MNEICQNTVAAGNVQFLKNWKKIGKRRVKNTGKNNVNIVHLAACKILNSNSKGYSNHCWRRSMATNLANAGVSLSNLKRYGQWPPDRVVEDFIATTSSGALELPLTCRGKWISWAGQQQTKYASNWNKWFVHIPFQLQQKLTYRSINKNWGTDPEQVLPAQHARHENRNDRYNRFRSTSTRSYISQPDHPGSTTIHHECYIQPTKQCLDQNDNNWKNHETR